MSVEIFATEPAVEEMGKVVNGVSKPLTADYDLFALAPNTEKQ
ncbi:hypothetical protein PDQ31_18010 [Bacillus cereus]|nr:hypothetical protein [Bacillus cereus]